MIREMTAADLEAVLSIEEAVYQAPWSTAMFEDELDRDNRHYLVIEAGMAGERVAGDMESGDKVAGYGGLMLVGEEAHVVTLAIAPDLHGGGLGSALLAAMFVAARHRGARHLTLEVRASNHPARSLYQRFGFDEVGVRKGYYGDEDAVIMFAHDIDRYIDADRSAEAAGG